MDERDDADGAGDPEGEPDDGEGDPEAFGFETTVPVRYRDLDTYAHVNNAVLATYLETARVEYLRETVGFDAAGGVVVARLEVDYETPLSFEDGPATVEVRVPRLGGSSFPMRYAVTADGGRRVATGRTVQVTVDGAGESRPIPDDWRASIAAFEGVPEGPEPSDG